MTRPSRPHQTRSDVGTERTPPLAIAAAARVTTPARITAVNISTSGRQRSITVNMAIPSTACKAIR